MNYTTYSQEPFPPVTPGIHYDIGALLALDFSIGTGGNTTIECLSTQGRREYAFFVIDPGYPLSSSVEAVTAADKLEYIRTQLCMNVTDVARALKVSRQSIYAWSSGGTISAENFQKLEDLVQAANVIADARIRVTRPLMQRSITSGMNLLDIAAAGGSASTAAEDLVKIIRTELRQRERLNARLATRTPPQSDNYVDLGAPMLDEET